MKNFILLLLCAAFPFAAFAQSQTTRPKITGIDHVCFYTTSPDGVKHLYADILGLVSADPIEPGETVRYMSGKQWVGYSPAARPQGHRPHGPCRLHHQQHRWNRRYLTEKGIKPGKIEGRSNHSLTFT